MRTLELLSINNPVAQLYNTNKVRYAEVQIEADDYDFISDTEALYLQNPTNENFMNWLASV